MRGYLNQCQIIVSVPTGIDTTNAANINQRGDNTEQYEQHKYQQYKTNSRPEIQIGNQVLWFPPISL